MTSDELVSDKNATMLLGKWNDHLAHSQDQIMGVKWGVYSNKFQGREWIIDIFSLTLSTYTESPVNLIT